MKTILERPLHRLILLPLAACAALAPSRAEAVNSSQVKSLFKDPAFDRAIADFERVDEEARK
ncbi:MAG: hypothetical protein ABSF95_13520 [Verrucomicrobiota bacterium]|jgi:hypothetical protein